MEKKEQKPRKYQQGKFTYLLYDDDKTATILEGYIEQGATTYCIPDHVIVDGVRYTIEMVEDGAYDQVETLESIVIPDSLILIPDDCFSDLPNLQSVYIGKNVRCLSSSEFEGCPKLQTYHIDEDNQYIKLCNNLVLSKDGKIVYGRVGDPQHLIVPEGVERIDAYACRRMEKLETVSFPSTLREIGGDAFSTCPNLREVVLPEGLEQCDTWAFYGNSSLKLIDFPSTLTKNGWMMFALCPNLETIVLRMPNMPEDIEDTDFDMVPNYSCRLYVPANLVKQYREHPVWGLFRNILPIERLATNSANKRD